MKGKVRGKDSRSRVVEGKSGVQDEARGVSEKMSSRESQIYQWKLDVSRCQMFKRKHHNEITNDSKFPEILKIALDAANGNEARDMLKAALDVANDYIFLDMLKDTLDRAHYDGSLEVLKAVFEVAREEPKAQRQGTALEEAAHKAELGKLEVSHKAEMEKLEAAHKAELGGLTTAAAAAIEHVEQWQEDVKGWQKTVEQQRQTIDLSRQTMALKVLGERYKMMFISAMIFIIFTLSTMVFLITLDFDWLVYSLPFFGPS